MGRAAEGGEVWKETICFSRSLILPSIQFRKKEAETDPTKLPQFLPPAESNRIIMTIPLPQMRSGAAADLAVSVDDYARNLESE